jgi:hypothetical protein
LAELGWTYLSRKSLRQAESQLAGDTQGVRDEIGFLLLHQHFADKFFPGTSVLQTRLRYVFFIPWMYQVIAGRGPSSSIEHEIADFEQRICGKLVGVFPRQLGVIGGRTWPKSISQPPSTVYWNSMSVWGLLLRGEDRRVMGKTRLRGLIQTNRRARQSGDEFSNELEALPFDTEIPAAPEEFVGAGALNFSLTAAEKTYLVSKLSRLTVGRNKITLLEKLIPALQKNAAAILRSTNCWDPTILKLATDDRASLKMAERAAAIVAIGRGVYAALVALAQRRP